LEYAIPNPPGSEVLEVKKGQTPMNNYEAPNIVRIGDAHELVLGIKPWYWWYIDSEGWFCYYERIDDIDESDD
jgi:hypothetical protein